MKKILTALTFILLLHQASLAQLTIQPVIQAVGIVQKNQLWNILIVNGSNTNYRSYLQLKLTDRSTGLDVLTASTGQFDISSGAKQVNANLLNPIQYNYLTGSIDNRIQGLLPAGNYIACYQLLNGSAAKAEILAEECVQFDVEPLSPPMLIFPADSSILENAPTQFSWMPPTPQGMFARLRYELLITEITEGQKAEEALQNNIPFYNDGALMMNNMVYPSSAIAFEKGKWYAWQVTARDDNAYAGKSEAWVFKMDKTLKELKPVPAIYLLLQDDKRGDYQIDGKVLHVKYFSYDNVYESIVSFTDANGNVIKTAKQKLTPGDNYLDFTLSEEFGSGRLYHLIITGKNNKRHTLTFSINTK